MYDYFELLTVIFFIETGFLKIVQISVVEVSYRFSTVYSSFIVLKVKFKTSMYITENRA